MSTETAQRNLVSYSLQVADRPLLEFLRLCDGPRVYFENERSATAFAGWGEIERVFASGAGRFQTVQAQIATHSQALWMQHHDLPRAIGPRWFGGFSFRSSHQPERVWSAFPAAHFFLPQFQLTRLKDQTWLTINDHADAGERPEQTLSRLQKKAQQIDVQLPLPAAAAASGVAADIDYLMDEPTWRALITKTTSRIQRGELEKVVLAQACRVRWAHPVEPIDVLGQLKQRYPNCYRFLIEPLPGHAFFGATPELLACVNDTTVETVAVASSIRRGKTAQEDRELGQKLLDSAKERHEHEVVVRGVEKNLSPLVARLDVAEQPDVVQLSNIQHLRTKICGELSQNCGILPVVEALHPTPAMGGTPRDVALRMIETEEPFQRGWYASPVGWVDWEGNGLFAVAIRSAIHSNDETQLFAGAGIVADSDPRREWAEVQLKFRPILDALRLNSR